MSQKNAEAVRGVYERWSQGHFRASVDVLDPLVLFVVPSEFPDAGTYLGLDRVAEYTRGFLEPWTRIAIEAEQITAAGDSVVVAVRQGAVGGESGAKTEFRYFRERAEALEAVALRE